MFDLNFEEELLCWFFVVFMVGDVDLMVDEDIVDLMFWL